MFTNAKRKWKPVGMLLLAGQNMEVSNDHLGERMVQLNVEQMGVGKEYDVVQKTPAHFLNF